MYTLLLPQQTRSEYTPVDARSSTSVLRVDPVTTFSVMHTCSDTINDEHFCKRMRYKRLICTQYSKERVSFRVKRWPKHVVCLYLFKQENPSSV